jgi:hypothetical protein
MGNRAKKNKEQSPPRWMASLKSEPEMEKFEKWSSQILQNHLEEE